MIKVKYANYWGENVKTPREERKERELWNIHHTDMPLFDKIHQEHRVYNDERIEKLEYTMVDLFNLVRLILEM